MESISVFQKKKMLFFKPFFDVEKYLLAQHSSHYYAGLNANCGPRKNYIKCQIYDV